MKRILYIFAGGFMGAILRDLASKVHIIDNGTFPINTIVVNLLGCLLLSFATYLAEEEMSLKEDLHVAMTTGLLGAFTTFATFSKDFTVLLLDGYKMYALIYMLVSLIGGFAFVFIGHRLAMKISRIVKF